MATTQTPYESRYHKIIRVDELVFGAKRKFRAAGGDLYLTRDETGVIATDERGAKLPTRIDDGEVWVCIEECRP